VVWTGTGTLFWPAACRSLTNKDRLWVGRHQPRHQCAEAAEEALRRSHDELERRVLERTAELSEINQELSAEIEVRKRAEDALRQASAYHRSLIEASLDPLVTIAPAGTITDVNHATEEVTGRPRQELIGHRFLRLLHGPGKGAPGVSASLSRRLGSGL